MPVAAARDPGHAGNPDPAPEPADRDLVAAVFTVMENGA